MEYFRKPSSHLILAVITFVAGTVNANDSHWYWVVAGVAMLCYGGHHFFIWLRRR